VRWLHNFERGDAAGPYLTLPAVDVSGEALGPNSSPLLRSGSRVRRFPFPGERGRGPENLKNPDTFFLTPDFYFV